MLMEWAGKHPKDAHFNLIIDYIMDNYQNFFPGLTAPPPVLYLDIWPLGLPLMIVVDLELSVHFTQDLAFPKHDNFKAIMVPLTKGIDMNTISGQAWKFWRTIFNPVFSARNITALVPQMLEEVHVFAETLRNRAGKDGSWGSVFPLEDDTTNLTFDVVGRAIL